MVYGLGILSYLLEIFLFRELFVLLQGQDMVIGWMYLVWFVFSGLGAFLFSLVRSRSRFWVDFWLVSVPYVLVFFSLLIVFLRWSPKLCLGAEMSIGQSFLTTVAILSVPAFFSGLGFALFRSWLGDASFVFSRESIGFGITALIVFLGLEYGVPLQWMIAGGFILIPFMLRRQYKAIGWGLMILPLLVLFQMDKIEQHKVCARGHLVLRQETPSGRIEVWQRGDSRAMFFNRRYVTDFKEYAFSETTVHAVLLNMNKVERVLILGDMARGLAREVLKYPEVKDVLVVERERAILKLEEGLYKDPRVQFALLKDVLWQDEHGFDVVFLAMAPPDNIAGAGFFSVEFISTLRKMLRKDGWLVMTVPGSESFLSPELTAFIAGVVKTMRVVFPEVNLLVGRTTLIVGGSKRFVWDEQTLRSRYNQREIENRFFNPYNWSVLFSPFRQSLMRARIFSVINQAQVSSRWYPFAYRYFWLYKLREQGGVWQRWAKRLLPLWTVSFLIVSLLLLVLLFSPWRERLRADVAISSYLHMGLYLLLIYGLQAGWATFFRDMAILSGAYMIGLGLGSLTPLSCKAYWRVLLLVICISVVLGLFPISRYLIVVNVLLLSWLQGRFLSTMFSQEPLPEKVYLADLIGAGLASLLVSPMVVLEWGLVGPWVVFSLIGFIIFSLGQRCLP